jgi:hypothetical protein
MSVAIRVTALLQVKASGRERKYNDDRLKEVR